MQRLVALVLLACLSASVVGRTAVAKDPPPQSADKSSTVRPAEAAKSDFLVGDPVRYQNLTVFPVSSRLPRTEDRFLTLDEGLKAGTVQVFEVGSQPPVRLAPQHLVRLLPSQRTVPLTIRSSRLPRRRSQGRRRPVVRQPTAIPSPCPVKALTSTG